VELDAVTEAAAADAVPFEAFYERHYRGTVALAALLVRDRGHAAEIAQEAFGVAFTRWAAVERYERPDLWLRRVVINRAISRRRRLASELRAMAQVGRSRSTVVDAADELAGVWVHVRSLPRRQAEALALVYGCDLSVDEAAQVMRCSAGSVKTHLSRGRAAVAKILEERS
jgi:RNA polymerase sigma-70 factor (ECF subfamily)